MTSSPTDHWRRARLLATPEQTTSENRRSRYEQRREYQRNGRAYEPEQQCDGGRDDLGQPENEPSTSYIHSLTPRSHLAPVLVHQPELR